MLIAAHIIQSHHLIQRLHLTTHPIHPHTMTPHIHHPRTMIHHQVCVAVHIIDSITQILYGQRDHKVFFILYIISSI